MLASTKIVNVNVFCGINTVSEPVVEKETNLLNLQTRRVLHCYQ